MILILLCLLPNEHRSLLPILSVETRKLKFSLVISVHYIFLLPRLLLCHLIDEITTELDEEEIGKFDGNIEIT